MYEKIISFFLNKLKMLNLQFTLAYKKTKLLLNNILLARFSLKAKLFGSSLLNKTKLN